MSDEKQTIKIGGMHRPIRLRKYIIDKIIARYNIIYYLTKRQFEKKNKREYNPQTDILPINNIFFYDALWKILIKRGFWPFKKPFRSLSHMIKEIEIDEVQGMLNLISKEILKMEEIEVDESEKKKH